MMMMTTKMLTDDDDDDGDDDCDDDDYDDDDDDENDDADGDDDDGALEFRLWQREQEDVLFQIFEFSGFASFAPGAKINKNRVRVFESSTLVQNLLQH